MTILMTSERFLSFFLGKEEYGIPLLSVREVIAMPEITPIPFTPSHFLGIMNLRGQVISIIDLRTKFNIKPTQTSETAVVICDLGALSLGIVVDSVNAVIAPADGELSPKPDIQSNKASDYITGVYRKGDRLLLFLDLARTLDVKDITTIKSAVEQKAA